jgi:hypothetical protein
MNDEAGPLHGPDAGRGAGAFERRAGELLAASAERLDGGTRSRLAQARHVALAELEGPRAGAFRVPGFWLPAGTIAAATLLALAVWLRTPSPDALTLAAGGTDVSPVEDLAILASADEPDLYAEDADFYEWVGATVDGSFESRGG